jgi:hypothetical protein
MTQGQKKHCKGCTAHWTHGIKDGSHDNWCTSYGKPAVEAIGQCKNEGTKELLLSKYKYGCLKHDS